MQIFFVAQLAFDFWRSLALSLFVPAQHMYVLRLAVSL